MEELRGELNIQTPSGGKRRKVRPAAVMLCAALAVACIWAGAGYVNYRQGEAALAREDYAAAETYFRAAGSFRDAAARAEEADRMQTYLEGLQCMESGDFFRARDLFYPLYKEGFLVSEELMAEADDAWRYQWALELLAAEDYRDALEEFLWLKDYRDAEQMAQKASRLERAKSVYEAALTQMERDPRGAYALLREIVQEDYKDTRQLMDAIEETVYRDVMQKAAAGKLPALWPDLIFLESAESARFSDVRAQLLESERIMPDERFLQTEAKRLEHFDRNTTAEEFAKTFVWMFLHGKTRLTLAGTKEAAAYSSEIHARIRVRAIEGYGIAGEWLTEYASIYQNVYIFTSWTDSGAIELTLRADWGNPRSDAELLADVETMDTFCRESVRALNEELLLGASMSAQQKARVIYDWIRYFLKYDDSMEIRNSGVAVDGNLGVCQSYVGLYNRMCNLAGIRTCGQLGDADGPDNDSTHIWTIQLDEAGNVFYTDATWGDVVKYDFSEGELYWEPTVESFAECYRLKDSGESAFWRGDKAEKYFWQPELWETHVPDRPAEEILSLPRS